MKTSTGISPLLRKGGHTAVSDADKVGILNTFFLMYLQEKIIRIYIILNRGKIRGNNTDK